MDALTEKDLELLEQHLDGELSPVEVADLHARLRDEQALAEMFQELVAERTERAAAWDAMEPPAATGDAFVSRMRAATRRQNVLAAVWRSARFGSVAAACLLVGITAGWLERGRGAGEFVGRGPNAVLTPVSSDGPAVSTSYPFNLGVALNEVRYEDPARAAVPLLLIRSVMPGTAAAEAGLRQGDLLLSVDGQPVLDAASLAEMLANRDGTRVLRVVRRGQILQIEVRVGR